MDIQFIEKVITNKLSSVDAGEKTVVINGQYLSFRQKTVYAELSENKTLLFFIREASNSDKNIIIKSYVTKQVLTLIYDTVCSGQLGRFSYGSNVPPQKCSVVVDGSLDLLIIEGTLYNIARKAIQQNNARAEIKMPDLILTNMQLQQLIVAFKEVSFENYYKFIFNKMQRRVLNRCYKKRPFFNILHAFIPVIISYRYIYNPLIDDPSDNIFNDSRIMHTALDNKRKIEVNEDLYCYMLTHEEICHCFGLTNFMRFTPQFFYRYLVGLLHPELPTFPTKTRTIYARPSDSESSKYKVFYNEEDFNTLLATLAERADTLTTEEDTIQLNKELEILNSYVNVDALFYEIDRHRRSLINIGANQADMHVTTETLYNIIVDGALLVGGA